MVIHIPSTNELTRSIHWFLKGIVTTFLCSIFVVQTASAAGFAWTTPVQTQPQQQQQQSRQSSFSWVWNKPIPKVIPAKTSRSFTFVWDKPDTVAEGRKDTRFFQDLVGIEELTFPLSIAVNQVLEKYQQQQQAHRSSGFTFVYSSASTTSEPSQSIVAPPASGFTRIGVSKDDTAIFDAFYKLMASTTQVDFFLKDYFDTKSVCPYVFLIEYVWELYARRIKQLTTEGKTDEAQGDAARAFFPNSTPLNLYNQLSNQLLSYIAMRLAMFDVDTFGSPGSFYFLNTELPQLDALMVTVEKTFSDRMSGSSKNGFPSVAGIPGVDGTTLTNNYLAIKKLYDLKKAEVIVKFCIQLFQALNVRCSLNGALSGMQTTLLGYNLCSVNGTLNSELVTILACLQNYYRLGQSGLALFSQEDPLPSVGIYKNPQLAFQEFARLSGSFYLYAALIGKNNIESLCNTPAALASQNVITASSATDTFSPQVQGILNQTQQMYKNAAQAFAQQYDVARSSAYNQIGSFLQAGLQYWVKATGYVAKSDFPDAINAYQAAAVMFKRAGLFQLSTTMLRKSDATTLAYYQILLQSYTEYYQLMIPTVINQMSTAPSDPTTFQEAVTWHTSYPNGLIQLFYYDPGANPPASPPTFRGIGWLAENALPSFLTMLNMYQTDTSEGGKTIKPYLAQSIKVLKNLAEGLHGIFYNDPLSKNTSLKLSSQQSTGALEDAEGKAANANIGSFTVQGVVEGRLQYMKVYELLQTVDTTLAAQNGQQNQVFPLPFQGLFANQSVSGFADFSLLLYLYWTLMNVDPCLSEISSYADYTASFVSTALISLVYAQAALNDPALQGVFDGAFITQKITKIIKATYQSKNPIELLLDEGKKLLSKAQTALDYESAIACFQVAAVLLKTYTSVQLSESPESLYELALKKQAAWYLAQSGMSFSSLSAAFASYRLVLAQKSGWNVGSGALQNVSQNMNSFLTDFSNSIQSLTGAIDQKAIARLQNFVQLQDQMSYLLVRQMREKQFFDLTAKSLPDFLSFSLSKASSGPAMSQVPGSITTGWQPLITYSCPLVPSLVFPQLVDPQYNLAQFYYDQATQLLNQLTEDFKSRKYQTSIQETYQTITQNFAQAAQYFSESDHQEQVVMVQQAITNATAFAYFSSVIPANSTQYLLQTYLKKVTFSPTFFLDQRKNNPVTTDVEPHKRSTGFSFSYTDQPTDVIDRDPTHRSSGFTFTVPEKKPSTTDTQTASDGPTTVPLIPAVEPDYLIRYFENDLTVLATQEKDIENTQAPVVIAQHPAVIAAQKSGVSVVLPPTAPSYQSILQAAQTLLGKNNTIKTTFSDTELVKAVVTPLYRKVIVDGGYTSQFNTVDQEVDRYKKQVLGLVTGGVLIGDNARLFAEYSLEKKKMSDGTEHIILMTHNGPLQALPRFDLETETALFYYRQYSQFFSITPATIQVGQSVFYQISDPTGSLKGAAYKYIIGSYLSKITDYMDIVKNCMKMAPPQLSLKELKNYLFAPPYSTVYQLLQSAYQWVFSISGSISDAQTNYGVYWLQSDLLNSIYLEHYKMNRDDSRRFLLGSPFSSTYQNVLKEIEGLTYMGIGVTQNAQEQTELYKTLGDCYKDASETEFYFTKSVPSVGTITDADGNQVPYPNSGPTNIPTAPLNFTQQLGTCPLPAANPIQSPQSPFEITWAPYYDSAAYLMQAIKQYTKAYTIFQTGTTNPISSDPSTQYAFGMNALYMMRAVGQRLSLFGRNAFTATITQASSGDDAIALGTSPQFEQIIEQGQNGGAAAAAQGFSALSGGALTQTSSLQVQQQYNLMKQLVLDSMIYASSLMKTFADAVKDFPTPATSSTDQDVVGGKAIKCAVGYYMPGLQMLAAKKIKKGAEYQAGTVGANQTEDVETEISALAYPDISIQKLGIPDIKQLACSNTLIGFIDYCMTTILKPYYDGKIGLVQFAGLTDRAHVAALSDFTSQIYSMLQEVYTWNFLPTAPPDNGSDAYKNYLESNQQAISAAIKAEEQNMVINSESYVG